jgi:hypothetical protein
MKIDEIIRVENEPFEIYITGSLGKTRIEVITIYLN